VLLFNSITRDIPDATSSDKQLMKVRHVNQSKNNNGALKFRFLIVKVKNVKASGEKTNAINMLKLKKIKS